MKLSNITFLAGLLLLVAPLALRGQIGNVIFNDTFADGERSTQNLPNSVAWYHNTSSAIPVSYLEVRSGALNFVVNDIGRALWAYFPVVRLQVGESVTFSFEYKWSIAPATTFRVGLCYTNGVAPTARDGSGPGGAYQGYAVTPTTLARVSGNPFYKRNGPTASNPASALIGSFGGGDSAVWLPVDDGTGMVGMPQANVPYTITFTVARTNVDRASLSTRITGGGITLSNIATASDPAGIFSNFDTLVIGFSTGSYAGDMVVTRAQVVADQHPRIITQPVAAITAKPGALATFTVAIGSDAAPTFQWQRKPAGSSLWSNVTNGAGYAGATTATLTVSNLTAAMDGDQFRGVISNRIGDTISSASTLSVDTSRLVNLSVRSNAGTGADTLIVGFAVGGNGTKQVLLRAIGPGLAAFGVSGTVVDPQLSLFDGAGRPSNQNDDWGSGVTLSGLFASVGAFALPTGSKDAALAVGLAPGAYSMQTLGAGGATGVALVEGYDTDGGSPTARLVNLSARNRVGIGDDILIAGFVITGNRAKPVLIRAIGPTLSVFGVSDSLLDPKLELHGTSLLQSNDNWGGGTQLSAAFAPVGAFALPADSRDAALIANLPPGSYTVQVSGVGNTTGVALVELYELP